MLSAICFNLDQSKLLLSFYGLKALWDKEILIILSCFSLSIELYNTKMLIYQVTRVFFSKRKLFPTAQAHFYNT